MSVDLWLDPYLAEICARSGDRPVLELGCGRGVDSAVLVHAGCRVVGIDKSAAAVAQATERVPAALFYCQDMLEPFPLRSGDVGVVVASLCLHYFPWRETLRLVQRLRDVLSPGGMLICRLNSTNDRHHGSIGHPQLDRNYFLVNGRPKRFFDQTDVDLLFASGWHVRTRVEEVIERYAKPKVIWRVVGDVAA